MGAYWKATTVALIGDPGALDVVMTAPSCSKALRSNEPAIAEAHCLVISNQWVNPESKHLVIAAPNSFLLALPGQFFHLLCPSAGSDRAFLRRPMSLYSIDRQRGYVEFLYKVKGVGTRGLATLVKGDILNVVGPLGTGFDLGQAGDHALLAGRGTGIATLTHLAERIRARGGRVTAVLSARATELLLSVDRLRSLGVRVLCVVDEDGSSDIDALRETLQQLHGEDAFSYVATCGSQRLIRLLSSVEGLRELPGQAAIEQHMACAIGMCFACVHPVRPEPNSMAISYQRVCMEGPVFDLARVLV